MSSPPITHPTLPPPRLARYNRLLLAVSVLIIAGFFLFPPVTVLDKTHLVGYAICHQIPDRTIHIGERPLPLCARCTGTYLGALMGLVGLSLLKRYRSTEFPPTLVLGLLVSFIAVMGFDGVNSYLTLLNAPHLYEPHNWLRLTTGAFNGLAMSVIIFPVISASLWHASLVRPERVLNSFKELVPFLIGGSLIILVVLSEQPILLYPLAILSTVGVLLMLGLVNMGLVLIVTRREGYARTWSDVILPAMMGLAVSFLLIGGMDWLRATVTRSLGLPF